MTNLSFLVEKPPTLFIHALVSHAPVIKLPWKKKKCFDEIFPLRHGPVTFPSALWRLIVLCLLLLQRMVIGTAGQMVARIASEAGEDLSRVFLRDVKLKLSVKLRG